MKPTLLAITGSYRKGHTIHQTVARMLTTAREEGAETECIDLLDQRIGFCTNCRICTQSPGENPGACPLADDMAGIIERIEAADGLVFAAPVNFYTTTALFKRFEERLVCYAYWPWGAPQPQFRRAKPVKPALLVTSSAMPGCLVSLTTGAMRALKVTARTVGARPVGRLAIGLAASRSDQELAQRPAGRADRLGRTLVERCRRQMP